MDLLSALWPDPAESFFRDRCLTHHRGIGATCVATSLAILTGVSPSEFIESVNTQNPVSWSEALRPFGMKLAYLPTDIRRLRFYIEELIGYDDLFTLGYYTPHEAAELLADPWEGGWLCGSHVVVLHRGLIYDPDRLEPVAAREHSCLNAYTKRVFRVVPAGHARGL